MNLTEKAKLTEAEIGSLAAWRAVSSHEFYADQRLIAAAQLAKALWAVVDWLANEAHLPDREPMHRDQDRLRARQLSDVLQNAGMTEPKP